MLLKSWIKQIQNIFNKDVENFPLFYVKITIFPLVIQHKLTKHFFDFNRRF